MTSSSDYCVFHFFSYSGENPLPPDDPNKELMGKTEVSLTLTNKFDVPGEANAEMDAKTLLLKWVQLNCFKILRFLEDFSVIKCLYSTKRLIVDVIRFQPGETLTEILDSTATPEQVIPHILLDEDDRIFDTVGKISLCFLGNRKQNTSGPCRGGPSEMLRLQRRWSRSNRWWMTVWRFRGRRTRSRVTCRDWQSWARLIRRTATRTSSTTSPRWREKTERAPSQ